MRDYIEELTGVPPYSSVKLFNQYEITVQIFVGDIHVGESIFYVNADLWDQFEVANMLPKFIPLVDGSDSPMVAGLEEKARIETERNKLRSKQARDGVVRQHACDYLYKHMSYNYSQRG